MHWLATLFHKKKLPVSGNKVKRVVSLAMRIINEEPNHEQSRYIPMWKLVIGLLLTIYLHNVTVAVNSLNIIK